ncbi:MAG: hypothetical protein AAFR74_01790 [Pseudomonadota bacterium]
MDADEFARRVGDRLVHVTLAENVESIERYGLMRPRRLAKTCGVDPESILLRSDAFFLSTGDLKARLNHQRPLRAGRAQESAFLDGYTLESWAAQLDERLFFWAQRRGDAFAASLKDRGKQTVLELDSRRFFDAFVEYIDLSPINSGSAMRRASFRGDWIYVPVTAGWEAFATNRIARGLAKTRDSVVEVSLRGDIPAQTLSHLIA